MDLLLAGPALILLAPLMAVIAGLVMGARSFLGEG